MVSAQLSRTHPPRPYRCPPWDGGPLAGRTVLLWSEQGLGDAIQFVRFAAALADRGGRVVVECPAPLAEVFATAPGVAAVVAEGEPLPPADCQVSMMSVPALTGLTADAIPFADRPYLSADPVRVARWREWFGRGPGRKVGLVWQGNPRHKWDRYRSRPLSKLVELAAGPGVTLFSLQRGHGTEQLAKWKGPPEVVAILVVHAMRMVEAFAWKSGDEALKAKAKASLDAATGDYKMITVRYKPESGANVFTPLQLNETKR